MKRIIHIFLLMIGMAGFSCTDFLTEDPKGMLTDKNFFASKSDLDQALNGLYAAVAEMQHGNNYYGTNFLGGDDITTHPASNKQPLREYDQYSVSANNAWMSTLWSARWGMIRIASYIINNAARTPDASSDDIKHTIAQACYWRAYNLFYVVQTWGKVPLILSDGTDSNIDYNAPLAPLEDIYNQIVEDLKKAEEAPANYTAAPYFKNGINYAVSQGAAKATLAYVYLSMAGWPLNKGAEYYQLAAQKAEEVIDGVTNGTYYYQLLPNYADVYSSKYNYNNPELLLGVYYNFQVRITRSAVADFLGDMAQGGWDDSHGEIKFWKDFPNGPRKEATYFPKIHYGGALRDWWYDDGGKRPVVAPCFMKSVEVQGGEFNYTNPAGLHYDGEKTHQVIRLSEVYCWYAEAVGRSGQVTPKAVEALNKVRNRADGAASNRYTTAMTPTDLAEAAYNEHGWEIAGYYWGCLAPRYFDMFRMYRVKDHFEVRKSNVPVNVASGVYRSEAVPVVGGWDDSKMYAPYPVGDATLNPNLTH
jgi:hypothetical protein